MNNSSIKDVSFDDAATSAMGEAFDQSLQIVPEFGPAC